MPATKPVWPKAFAAVAGCLLGLALLKFGNPVILDRLVEPPKTPLEFVFNSWPVDWGYCMLATVVVTGLPVARFKTNAPRWIVILPLIWFVWQLVAAANTVDSKLTRATVTHFAACLVWFYLGLFALSRVKGLSLFWFFLILAFAWVLWMGFEQYFGGLEATRRMVYALPDWQQFPPEYLKRVASNRIFSTLLYPNALAGAILLLLPILMTSLRRLAYLQLDFLGGQIGDGVKIALRVLGGVVVGLLAYGGLACLYWSGSKSGWLIALVLTLVAFLRLPLQRRFKLAIATVSLAVGLTAFFVKFSDYFGRGATSIGARFDYWRAAWEITVANPIFGTGPGTFSVPYGKLKAPNSEPTRLVHNDYLEQAADSGLVGFLTYLAFIPGSLVILYRKLSEDPLRVSAWLGLSGWAMQGFVEFGLYIPALAWPAFALTGWLWGTASNEKSTSERPGHSLPST